MINHHGINYFYAGSKGKIRMQAIAADVFLRNPAVSVVVFQGEIRGLRRTYSVKRSV